MYVANIKIILKAKILDIFIFLGTLQSLDLQSSLIKFLISLKV